MIHAPKCAEKAAVHPGPCPIPETSVAHTDMSDDPVVHPSHYTSAVPGIECIDVVQHFNFNRGNAIKYLWRAGSKGDTVEDLMKARQYIDFEIARVENQTE